MEKLVIKRSSLENLGYLFIPLNCKVTGDKNNHTAHLSLEEAIMIPLGEDIESSLYLKNKFGVVVELVD